MDRSATAHPLVLFDGVCNLCNGVVSFLVERDPHAILRFASLQSEAARAALRGVAGPLAADDGGRPASIVLVEGGRVYRESTAALRTTRHLRGAWPGLAILLVVPRPIRDGVYRWVAQNRYRWFGRTDTCRVPTPEIRARFVDDGLGTGA